MKIPTKKLKNGFEMPIFGLGTWMMGGKHTHDPDNDDERDIQAIQLAIEMGITHIDTAEKYADGYAETLIGQAIGGYDRSKLFIVSKASNSFFKYDSLINSCKSSLGRLHIDYLDLFLLHSPSLDIPLKETMRAMDDLKKQGLIKNIGLSNYNISRFEEAQSHTKNKIVANQLHLNLIYREPERKGLVDYCQKNDVMFIAWRPLQKGIFLSSNSILEEMCKKYGKTSSQIAINWLISQDNIVTLSKMTKKEHFEENLGALGWNIEKADIEKLDKEFPDQKDISDAVPLI